MGLSVEREPAPQGDREFLVLLGFSRLSTTRTEVRKCSPSQLQSQRALQQQVEDQRESQAYPLRTACYPDFRPPRRTHPPQVRSTGWFACIRDRYTISTTQQCSPGRSSVFHQGTHRHHSGGQWCAADRLSPRVLCQLATPRTQVALLTIKSTVRPA